MKRKILIRNVFKIILSLIIIILCLIFFFYFFNLLWNFENFFLILFKMLNNCLTILLNFSFLNLFMYFYFFILYIVDIFYYYLIFLLYFILDHFYDLKYLYYHFLNKISKIQIVGLHDILASVKSPDIMRLKTIKRSIKVEYFFWRNTSLKIFLKKPIYVIEKIKLLFLNFITVDFMGRNLKKNLVTEGSLQYRRKISIFKTIIKYTRNDVNPFTRRKTLLNRDPYFSHAKTDIGTVKSSFDFGDINFEKKKKKRPSKWLLHNYIRIVGPYKFNEFRGYYHRRGRKIFFLSHNFFARKLNNSFHISVIYGLFFLLMQAFFILPYGTSFADMFSGEDEEDEFDYHIGLNLMQEFEEREFSVNEFIEPEEMQGFSVMLTPKKFGRENIKNMFYDQDAYWQWLVNYPINKIINDPRQNEELEKNKVKNKMSYIPRITHRQESLKYEYFSDIKEIKSFSFLYPLFYHFMKLFPYNLKDFFLFTDSGNAYKLFFCYLLYIPITVFLFLFKYILKFLNFFKFFHFYIKILFFILSFLFIIFLSIF